MIEPSTREHDHLGSGWIWDVVHAARDAVDADGCAFLLYENNRDIPVALAGLTAGDLVGEDALTPRLGDLDRVFLEGGAPGDHALMGGYGSVLLVPLRRACGAVMGCICCVAEGPSAFGAEHARTLGTIASLASTKITAAPQHDAFTREGIDLLEKLTTCVPGVLYRFDIEPDGRTRFPYSSARMRDVYNVDPEMVEHDASAAWETIHPDDLASVQASVETSRATLGTWRDRYRVIKPDGGVCWLEGEANPTRRDDGGTSWLGYIRDVTDDVEREQRLDEARREALEATKAKSEFLANIGHEVRTPLAAILGYAELLEAQADAFDGEDRDAIRTIRRNGEHLLGLVNDLLDISKVEAGRLTIERLEMSAIEVVADVLATMRVRAEAKGLALLVEWASVIPQRVHSDPTRLRQIIINLVSNAIKFTHEGSVTLRVSCDAPAQRLVFEVCDTGIGMTPEQLDTVRRFEAFTQADASTTRRFGGTGLGLRLCAALANELGDGLVLESTQGVGTTSLVRIATGDLSSTAFIDPGDRAVCGQTVIEERGLDGMRILLAEDGADNRRLLGHHLQRAGASVRTAEDGMLALEACAEEAFDLVLMDMMMPRMDGYDATRSLRQRGHAGPIVAITAHATDEDRDACLEAGCDGFLTKPISATSLVRACLRFTRRAEAA